MNFEYRSESIRTPALQLEYYLVPWDTQILGVPVAQISALQVADPAQGALDFAPFEAWCAQQRIELCACRLPLDRLAESMFLETRGFRFVELNYTPQLTGLQALQLHEQNVLIEPAAAEDSVALAIMAEHAFRHGRLHQDPRIDPALADRRYRIWLENAFTHPGQQVLKCIVDGTIVGFFVIESRAARHCFWSLTALAPEQQGRGLGKRVWRAMLHWHSAAGMETISTSISAHNVAVFNLYVALGFRFPQPSITLQWRPAGSGVLRRQ